MASCVEIPDFRKGRKTRRGKPVPPEEMPPEQLVTAVIPAAIDAFLGARSYTERLRHLRKLRDEGVLIHNRGRLTQVVGGQATGGERMRCYVFASYSHQVPRIDHRRPDRGRVRFLA